MKMGRSSSPSPSDSDDLSLGEQLLDAQDEIATLKDENASLKHRIFELEQQHLQQVRNDASESAKDARIAQLVQENQELLVVIKNADGEAEMRRLEQKHRRKLEKRDAYEEALKTALEQEQKVGWSLPL
jgi:hypothetical protein